MKYLNELLEYDKAHGVKHSKAIKRAIKKHKRIHKRALEGNINTGRISSKRHQFYRVAVYMTTGTLGLIKLQPAQKWWMELWWGYYTKDGAALIEETLLVIIRGAGKSTLMSALEAYWLLYGGNYGGESWVIAYDNNQAEHVYGQIRNQITAGDGLLKLLGDTKQLKTPKPASSASQQITK